VKNKRYLEFAVTEPTPAANQMPDPASNALDPAWVVEVRAIGETGQNARFEASAEQRASLARDLDLLACSVLTVAYKLRSQHRGRYRLTGTINADVVQRCIVTLEPVPATVTEELDVEFWPADQLAAKPTPGVTQQASDEHNDTADFAALGDEPPEPIEQGRIAIGRVVYELVSAGLDPYPRSPGAAFAFASSDNGKDNPFAALAELKATPKTDGSRGS
jgi:uncharacterized metal-binding protein YceD (DUF177 family)